MSQNRRETRDAQDSLDRILDTIERCRLAGLSARSDETLAAVQEHYRFIAQHRAPLTAAQYSRLGKGYWADPNLREMIGKGNDTSVKYLRDAMAMYANLRLS